jgi:hypothetical protein
MNLLATRWETVKPQHNLYQQHERNVRRATFLAAEPNDCKAWIKRSIVDGPDSSTCEFPYDARRLMIGAISGGEGLGSASSAYIAQQLQATGGPAASSSLTGGEAGGSASQSTASISGPGQLLSNLEQLQTQNPAKFQQVITQIVSQLQAAAQQTQGPTSNFLSHLASKFQATAGGTTPLHIQYHQLNNQAPTGGGIPLHIQHHQVNDRVRRVYNVADPSQPQSAAGVAQPSSLPSLNTPALQQLFASLSSEVSQALAS